jgi:hypothetical protein
MPIANMMTSIMAVLQIRVLQRSSAYPMTIVRRKGRGCAYGSPLIPVYLSLFAYEFETAGGEKL